MELPYVVRFLKGTEKEGYKLVADERFSTKPEAIVAIRRAGAVPSRKFLENGCVVRTAMLPVAGATKGSRI